MCPMGAFPISPTSSLEVERYHLAAAHPQKIGVVVGGIHPLAFGVDAAQGSAVIHQEFPRPALAGNLILHKGAYLFIAVLV